MFRWTERKDCCRLEISHEGVAALYGCLASSIGTGTLAATVLFVAAGPHLSEPAGFGMLVLVAFMMVLYWYCCSSLGGHRRIHGWAEIALRGGTARWGGPEAPEMPAAIPVRWFEATPVSGQGYSIEAVLPDGARRHVFGPWDARHLPLVHKTVLELNSNLGTIESSAATVPPPEPIVTASSNLRQLMEWWRRSPPPYRFELRSPSQLLLLIPLLGLIAHFCWRSWRDEDPYPLAYLVVGTGLGLWLLYRLRRIPWVEVATRGGTVYWGVGNRVVRPGARVLAFEAEPQATWTPRRWTIAAVHADGGRIQVFRRPDSLDQRTAVALAELLNWALQPPQSDAPASTR